MNNRKTHHPKVYLTEGQRIMAREICNSVWNLMEKHFGSKSKYVRENYTFLGFSSPRGANGIVERMTTISPYARDNSFVVPRDSPRKLALNRLGMVMASLGVQEQDELVNLVMEFDNQFVYPPSGVDIATFE